MIAKLVYSFSTTHQHTIGHFSAIKPSAICF